MASISSKIIKKIRSRGAGKWVCGPTDFLGLGDRAAVDQALSRLARAGQLRRVGRGLYDMPRISAALGGPAPVNIDSAIDAIARRDGIRIMPDGLVAANQLGLTNAVPAKASYVTDGPTRTLNIGGRTVRLRHARRKLMGWDRKPAAPVAQALQWLGSRAATDPRVLATLKHRLPDAVKDDLFGNRGNLPGWALPIARSLKPDAGAP